MAVAVLRQILLPTDMKDMHPSTPSKEQWDANWVGEGTPAPPPPLLLVVVGAAVIADAWIPGVEISQGYPILGGQGAALVAGDEMVFVTVWNSNADTVLCLERAAVIANAGIPRYSKKDLNSGSCVLDEGLGVPERGVFHDDDDGDSEDVWDNGNLEPYKPPSSKQLRRHHRKTVVAAENWRLANASSPVQVVESVFYKARNDDDTEKPDAVDLSQFFNYQYFACPARGTRNPTLTDFRCKHFKTEPNANNILLAATPR
ncbi:hypothetical protein EYZ11_011319 [Aspergillus tanneri]|uniref:Uncharacterized protein n=1 Tax=Aspergillus tanneri TaxID=1220188 RepID=A0A4S3J590_9EURO|nr:hypothetical protein EYZ11_011319 [Aspergillus tanneri]